MKKWNKENAIILAGLFFTCLFIEYLVFGDYLFHPNDYVFAFGGDALVIYYDMIYHICHDDSYLHLGATNYPYGDAIIMTDAQAGFSILLKFIHENITPVCDLTPGLVHFFILYLLPLTAIYLFLIFQKLGVNKGMAIGGSILITFLSPQILRIYGHFGLAYPFLIPMTIYWFLCKYEQLRWKWTDIIYMMVLFFFFINNPYLGFMAIATFLGASGVWLWQTRFHKGWSLLGLGLLPLVVGYLMIELSDPYTDRINQQWGFFYYFANVGGLLFPEGSFLHSFISLFYPHVPGSRFEARINIGLIPTLTIFSFIFYWVVKRIKKQNTIDIPPSLQCLLWASFLLFVYAANYSLYGFAKPFMEKYMGPLLMFKASGRLAWPFYYVLTIAAIYLLHRFYHHYKHKKVIYVLLLAGIVWAAEDGKMLRNRFANIHFANPFANAQTLADLNKIDLNIEDYQAIYLLPIIQVWHDKINFQLDFKTQYAATLLSVETAIPLINGMLSRAPTKHSYQSIQLASHPVIHREKIKDFQPDKKILLLLGNKKEKLTIGEQYLIDNADYLGEFYDASLYEITPDKMQGWKNHESPGEPPYLHHSFNDHTAEENLVGPGAIQTKPGNHVIWEGSLPDTLAQEAKLAVSIWYYSDYKTYYIPRLKVIYDGQQKTFYDKSSKDYIGYWVRQSIIIPGTTHLTLEAEGQVPMYFDELHIRPADKNTYHLVNGNQYWNGYPIITE